MTKPLILSPAGSYEALVSAINAGADEVYFGFGEFNARYNAKNFDETDAKRAFDLCRVLNVKTNITVNTLVTDREIPKVLDLVYNAASMGADAFIVQDLGLARCIKKSMPEVVLHASTQCACHNTDGVEKLSELGFSRVVLAREMSKEDIQRASSLGVETEMFVHGALCVCHSGQCLMSSCIGNRSGNRGLCAQPCRLPYSPINNKNNYPLSLKDLSLCSHIEEILSLGVTSLKIEGRMKSPEYVYGTTKIWRELIDNGKNANKQDIQKLENLFSRQGFTDKYFTGEYRVNNKDMYGVRTEQDKENSRQTTKDDNEQQIKKAKIQLCVEIEENKNATISARLRENEVLVVSDFVCPTASSRPLDENEVKKALAKLGNTPFYADENDIDVKIAGSVFLSKSMLNELRRMAVEKLENAVCSKKEIVRKDILQSNLKRERVKNTLLVYSANSMEKAKSVTDAECIFIALSEFDKDQLLLESDIGKIKASCKRFGVRMPRVVFDDEMDKCKSLLDKAKNLGAEICEISNIGQIKVAKQSGLELFASFGMNVYNSSTVEVLEQEGFGTICLSCELNEAQIRDIQKNEDTKLCAFVKGYLPLMVLESCIIKANGTCRGNETNGCYELCDRIGKRFKIYGEKRLKEGQKSCRNIIVNSVETDILKNEQKMQKMNVDMGLVLL